MADGRARSQGGADGLEGLALAELEADAEAGEPADAAGPWPIEALTGDPADWPGVASLAASGIAYNGNEPAITPERECWLDVLRRARLDLRGKRMYGEDAALARAEWIVWMQSPDFELVCDLAGLPARQVRRLLMAEIPNG